MTANDIDELLARARRIETRLHRLADALRVPQAAPDIGIERTPRGDTRAHLPGYDVTLAQVLRAAEAAELMPADGPLELWHLGRHLGTIYVKRT